MAVRVHRRETRGWPVLLSPALHLTVLLVWLIIPPTEPPSEPPTMDVVVGVGPPAAAPGPPAPTETTDAPPAPDAPVHRVGGAHTDRSPQAVTRAMRSAITGSASIRIARSCG